MSNSSDTEQDSKPKVSVSFQREQETTQVSVRAGSKLLVAAIKNKIEIRYGCSACRCGTCGVAVTSSTDGALSGIDQVEKDLMEKMNLPVDGSVRLACQARVLEGAVEVNLGFQSSYSPDDALDDEDEYYDDEY